MKKFLLPIFAIIMIAGISCQGEKKTASNKRVYPFEKATIVSRSEIHSGVSIRQDIYIDGYGAREARYTTTKMTYNDRDIETKALSMVTPDYIYTVDFQSRTGTRIPNDPDKVVEEMRKIIVSSKLDDRTKDQLISRLPEEKEAIKNSQTTGLVIKDFIKDLKPSGKEKLLDDLECDVYEIKDDSTGELQAKLYVWNYLPIKLVDVQGRVIQEVVSLDTTSVDTSVFSIPDSVKIEDWLETFANSIKQFEHQGK